MKLFKLLWIVRDGFNEYFRTDWMVFESEDSATKYGITREVEDNTGNEPDHAFSDDERQKARTLSSKNKQRHLQFFLADEVDYVNGEDGNFYDVSIKKKVFAHDEKKGNGL